MLDIYTWQNDLYPMVSKRFDSRYAMRTDVMKQVVGEEIIERIDLREEGIGGYGEIPEYDGTAIRELNQSRGFVTVFTPKEHAGQVKVSYKKTKVDLSGEAKKVGNRLADGAYMTVLMDFYRLFANGFKDTVKGGDGQPWFSENHPISSDKNSKKQSNLLHEDFTVANITKAQTMANRFVTPDGLPFLANMDLVLISPELEPKAKEYFGTDAKLIPGSNENGANPVYGMRYFVIGGGEDIGFTGGQWAVCDAELLKEAAKLVYITKPMILVNKEASNPLVAKYTAYMDYTFGFSDYRPIVASTGQ